MRFALYVPYAVVTGVALGLALLPIEVSIGRFIYEDYFYYLQLAQHLVSDGVVSFDGTAPTNGFHPLWLGLCSVAVWAFGSDAAVHTMLVVAALLHVVQTALVFAIVAKLTTPIYGHAAALFYGFNYRVLACNLCGLETPLSMALVLLVCLAIVRRDKPLDYRGALGLGLMLGVTVLARFDALLLSGAVVSLILADSRMAATVLERSKLALTTGATCLATLLPWFVWSMVHSNSLLPNSNAALNAGRRGPQLALDLSLGANLQIFHDKIFGALWWLSDTANLFGLLPVALPEDRKIGGILVGLLIAAVVFGLARLRRRCLPLLVLYAYALAHLSYYVFTARAEARYLLPLCALTIICAAAVVHGCAQNRPRIKVLAVVGYSVVFAVSAVAGVSAWRQHQGATRTHGGHYGLLRLGRWIDQNLPQDSVVGAWNAGIVSRYSNRTTVNLDGVVNDDAIDYLRRRTLAEYIAERGITHLADSEAQLIRFMDAYSGDRDWRDDYRQLRRIDGKVVLQRCPDADP